MFKISLGEPRGTLKVIPGHSLGTRTSLMDVDRFGCIDAVHMDQKRSISWLRFGLLSKVGYLLQDRISDVGALDD